MSHFNAYALRLAQLHLWFSGSFAKSACLYAARGLSQVTSSSSLRLWSLQCLQRHLLEQVAWRIVGQGKPSGTRDAPVLNWELNVEPKEFEDMVRQNCCIRTVPDTHPLDRLKTGRHVTKSHHRYRPIYMYVRPITSAPPNHFTESRCLSDSPFVRFGVDSAYYRSNIWKPNSWCVYGVLGSC